MKFEIPISRWAARAGSLQSDQEWKAWLKCPEDLETTISVQPFEGISSMRLRRLESLGRGALAVGNELLASVPEDQPLSVLTVSEFGELETNDGLIETIVSDELVSPQKFSASVHNHILGQLCINLKLPCAGGASTGANSSLEMGLVEALSEMAEGRWVLVIAYEPRINEHYARWCGGEAPEYVVGLLLRPDAEQRFRMEKTPGLDNRPQSGIYGLQWLSFVVGLKKIFQGREGWIWTHVDD